MRCRTPSRVFREGLKRLKHVGEKPIRADCTAASIDDVPTDIGGLSEQVLVLMSVRDGNNLGEALSAAKARFPDGHIIVVGNSRRRELVATAIALEATSFVDENVAPSTLIKQPELITQGEPIIYPETCVTSRCVMPLA